MRVYCIVADGCKKLAEREGWQFGDLARALIFMSACSATLSLRRSDRLETIKTTRALRRLSSGIDMALGKAGPSRPYAPRLAGRRNTALSLRLPESLWKTIDTYAKTLGISRNRAGSKFFEQGLLIYLNARKALAGAIGTLRENASD